MKPSEDDSTTDSKLSGTTLRVYRFLYKSGKPMGIRDVQRGLSLSSPSVAEYHLKKLLDMGLVKEDEGTSRFIVDRVMFENMIRFRRLLIPFQVGYVVFFGIALLLLVFLFRPQVFGSQYLFSLVVIAVACGIFVYQTMRSLRRSA